MRSLKKTTGTALSIPAGLGLGVLVSITVTLLGVTVIAWLLSAERIEEGSIGYIAMGILSIAAILGCLTAVGKTKRLRLQISMLSGACYFLTLLAITALFFGGRYQAVGTTLAIIVVCCALVAFLPGNKKGPRKPKSKRYR